MSFYFLSLICGATGNGVHVPYAQIRVHNFTVDTHWL